MEEVLHQLVDSLSHYLQGLIHPKWLFGISSINSSTGKWTRIESMYFLLKMVIFQPAMLVYQRVPRKILRNGFSSSQDGKIKEIFRGEWKKIISKDRKLFATGDNAMTLCNQMECSSLFCEFGSLRSGKDNMGGKPWKHLQLCI